MCVAVPMKIIEIRDREDEAVAELDGFEKEINISLMENLSIGDHVMVHAGFAIEKVDPAEVEKTLEVLREYAEKLSHIQ